MFGLIGGFFRFVVKMAVLAVGISVIIAYANLSDVDGWKRDLQQRLSTVAGRRLSIDGPIDFKVSFPPCIIAEGVRIENAAWGTERDMLKAGKVIAVVDLLPLLVGKVAVPSLQLVDVDILIEQNARGASNWDDLSGFMISGEPGPIARNFSVFGLASGQGGIGVSGGTLTISNLKTGDTNTLNLPRTSDNMAPSQVRSLSCS